MNTPSGFTLIELMVSIAMLSILLAIAVPSYQALVVNNRLATQTNEFVATLTLARSEAVKRGTRVTVCKSSDQSACTTTGDWTQGWLVFADDDSDGTFDTGEPLLQVHGALPSGVALTGNTLVSDYVSYIASGAAQRSSGAVQTGTLTMCHAQSGKARVLTVNNAGRLNLNSQATC